MMNEWILQIICCILRNEGLIVANSFLKFVNFFEPTSTTMLEHHSIGFRIRIIHQKRTNPSSFLLVLLHVAIPGFFPVRLLPLQSHRT